MNEFKRLSEDELKVLLQAQIDDAIGAESGEISGIRQDNYDRYLGKRYGDEKEGHSQVTTREVFETVEWALSSLMRVFSAGDKPVTFDPVGPEDEQAADQETEYLSHVILKENRSFMALQSWFKDGLMNPNGYIKCWWDPTEQVQTETHEYIHISQVAAMMEDQDVEIIGQELVDIAPEGEYYQIVAKHYDRAGRVKFAPVPPEEILVHSQHTEVNLDDADFVCHRSRKRITDLIEMGYDEEKVKQIPDDSDYDYHDERVNRLDYQDEWGQTNDTQDPSMRVVWIYECYIRVDMDGDGIAERRKIVMAGKEILENEEDPFIPIVSIGAIPMPHRHAALSYADVTVDIQRIETQLTRQLLNNLYRTNNPRPVIGVGVNREDVLNDAPNHPIRARDISQIRMEPVTPVLQQVLPALDHFKDKLSSRTGVNEHTMGLSPDTLAQSTAGAALMGFEQANGRLETVARNFAEGVKTLFIKVHQLLRNHSNVAKQVRLSQGWVPISPAQWRVREDMTINVGIGNATKEQKLVSAQAIMDVQEKMVAAGGMGMTVSPKNVYNAAALMVEAAGHTDPEKYFMDPETAPPPQPEGPDIQEQALMLQREIEQQKAQLEAQKLQIEATKADQQAMIDQQVNALKERELALKEQEILMKAQIEEAKLNKEDTGGADKIAEATIKAQAEIEKARIEAEARLAEASAASANQKTEAPVLHIHNGGRKNIQVKRTASGLEGTVDDAGED